MTRDFSMHVRLMEQDVPFNRHLGFKVLEIREGYVKTLIAYQPDFVGDPRRPALHGGFLASVVDACGGLAVWTNFEIEDLISTVDMRVDYLRPGPDKDIIAESRVVRTGNRVSVVNTVIYTSGNPEQVLVEGRAVYNTRRMSR